MGVVSALMLGIATSAFQSPPDTVGVWGGRAANGGENGGDGWEGEDDEQRCMWLANQPEALHLRTLVDHSRMRSW